MTWKNIKICGRCESIFCKCEFGTYKASTVYSNFREFLKARFK